MRSEQGKEAVRLCGARETLKIVWAAYRSGGDWIDKYDDEVQAALEVALDEIDLALLRLDNVDLTFEYRDDNENDSQ